MREEPGRRRATSDSPLEPQIGFSRAVRVGRHIAVAATAANWPDGRVVHDAGAQARRCLEIIGQALEELGAGLDDVVRTRVFLVDPADGPVVGRVHGELLGTVRPASGFIVVNGFLDPRWRVEIEADAIVDE
jgi:enamine deaminase RidA (YjgF/YER057c/UK114 family)